MKHEFKIALAAKGIPMAQWARMHNVARQTVWNVVNGRIKSRRLETLIKNFTHAELSKLYKSNGGFHTS
jgi:gp16 family phage-associated protein